MGILVSNKHCVTIYSDGSCSPNPGLGGWAAILIDPVNNRRKEISGVEENSTNNRMEIRSAIEALNCLKKPCEVTLHSDSKYLIDAFNQGWIENWQETKWVNSRGCPVANQDLWKNLLEVTSTHNIKWVWVKGHSNNIENELCDQLAVLARQEYIKNKGIRK